MKRNYSFVFAAIAILSAASCQKELVNAPETDTTNAAPFSFIAEREAETKTVLVEGKSTYWTPGDEISAIDSKGKAQTFIALNAVDMKTPLAENAPAALFYNEMFSIPADGSIHTIYPRKDDVTIDENGVIGILRIGSPQYAVEGSFDPQFASAYAKAEFDPENPQTPPTLTYTNIHTLVKFTIGGDKAPAEIVLTNNGSRNIAGQFKYNTMPEENKSPIIQLDDKGNVLPGGKAITLLPKKGESFEVGKTYYIVVIGGGNFANVTLSFDGEVVKTASDAKYAVAGNNYFLNKIINLGTVQFPAEEPEKPELSFNIERVWGFYSTTETEWWAGIADGFKGSWFGGDTSIAMDDEYIYIPFGTATPGVYKVNIKTQEISTLPVDGISGGTYPTSCARMVKNTDPSINNGKDILLVGNLALSGEPLKFYAYVNGTENAPEVVYNLDAARRFGDKFTVSGTWQSGIIWLRSNQDNPLEAVIPINAGKLQTWIDAYRITNEDDNCISEISWYPVSDNTKADYCLMSTTSDSGVHLMTGCTTAGAATEYAVYPALAKTFGYNFFEYDGEKYIAWASLKNGNSKPRLQIIKGDGSSLVTLDAALANYEKNLIAEFALANEENDLNKGGNEASKTLCDCAVRVIGDEVYIAALGEECGLSLIKISAK